MSYDCLHEYFQWCTWAMDNFNFGNYVVHKYFMVLALSTINRKISSIPVNLVKLFDIVNVKLKHDHAIVVAEKRVNDIN